MHPYFDYDRSMDAEADIALLGSLIGDPARASMLTALLSGKALTPSELAAEAGVTVQTASFHLGKLAGAGLTRQRKQGRHRYVSLADNDVANVLQAMLGLAAKRGQMRTRTGPKDPALRKARVCYHHLAGAFGVHMFDSLLARKYLAAGAENLELTDAGRAFVTGFGIVLEPLAKSRRPLCKACLDWSARRSHLAGALGTAFLDRFFALGWAERQGATRVVAFSEIGAARFFSDFPNEAP
jgi:DNA-binding transcriptional ArsR family regulator